MSRNRLGKKGLVVAVILLFLGMSVIPSISSREARRTNSPFTGGSTLYVGGSGEGNYTRIQDAINNASDGDTVSVYDDSSPYYENVIVDKSINLIGEDKNTTFVNFKDEYPYITFILTAGNIVIKGFSIRGGDGGIAVRSDQEYIANISILDCNIIDNYGGDGALSIKGDWIENVSINHCYFDNDFDVAVRINAYTEDKISDISFSHCCVYEDAVYISHVRYLKITDCDFMMSLIKIYANSNVQILNCTMDPSPRTALYIDGSHVTIDNCTFKNSSWGAIYITDSRDIHLSNCFIKNYEYKDAHGVVITAVDNFLMEGCIIENMNIGFYAFGAYWNTIVKNCHIANNKVGVQYFNRGVFNRYIQNNFINNTKQFKNEVAWFMVNIYKYNYWSDWNGRGPYHVYGFLNWDWNPVQEPYDIGV